MYIKKSKGPRIEPCDTPQVKMYVNQIQQIVFC